MNRFLRNAAAVVTAFSLIGAAFGSPGRIVREAAAEDVNVHDHSDWTPTNDLSSISSGKYYLNDSVTLSSEITINSGVDVTLCLNGNTITAASDSRIFNIDGGSLTLCDCQGGGKLTGVSFDGKGSNYVGGAVCVKKDSTFNMYGGEITNNVIFNGDGGGVYTDGMFNMYGGTISNNDVRKSDKIEYRCCYGGGGVFVDKNGNFTMHDGTISGNKANSLDGYGGGGVAVHGTFTMVDGKISKNKAAKGNAGVYVGRNTYKGNYTSSFTMNGGEISENEAKADNNGGSGGGVGLSGGAVFTMNNGKITKNIADGSGGGVYVGASTLIMNNGEISDNTARKGHGGGVFLSGTTTAAFTMKGGKISGNTSKDYMFTFNNVSTPQIKFGGGVYYMSGKFTIDGKVEIANNSHVDIDGNSTVSNVSFDCDYKPTITIGSGFATDSPIGVNTTAALDCGAPYDVAAFGTGVTAEDISDKFTEDIDIDGQSIVYNDEKVQLSVEHDWLDWTITKDPTKTTEGTAERVCNNNNEHKDTVTLPVLTDPSVWTNTQHVDPTEEQDGQDVYTSDYGDVTVILPQKEHTHVWGNWSITTPPTETTEGTAERVCNNNEDHKDTVTLPVLTDTSVWTNTQHVDPTEEQDGQDVYTSDYGDVTVILPQKEHTHVWGNWSITTPPTETTEGTAERVCNNNNEHKDTVTLPVLTDTSVWTKDNTQHVDPTEENDGRDVYTSAYGEVTVTILKDGHTHVWGNWTITTEPTKTTEGTAERACSCGEKETKTDVPALNDATVWTKTEQDDKDVYTSEYGTVEVAKTTNTPDTPDNPFTPVTPVDPVTPDNSDGNNSETSNTSNTKTEFTQTTEELIDAILSPEERAEIADGDNIRFILQIEDTDPAEDKPIVESVLAQQGELKLGQYIDVSLFKVVNGEKTQITKTNRPIGIKLEVPEDLRGQNRVFSVVRVHDGETTVLPDLDNDPDTVTIETDKFSTYALVYRESASAPDNSGNPSTGIAISLVPIAAAFAFITAAVIRKKK